MLIRLEANHKPNDATLRLPSSGQPPERLVRLSLLLGVATSVVGIWLVWRYSWVAVPVDGWAGAVLDIVTLFGWAAALTIGIVWLLIGRQWLAWRRGMLVTSLTVEQLQELSPAAFERYVATVFRQRGYEVTQRGSSGDLGVDLEVVNENGRRAVVQCKRYRSTVGPDVVRELYGTMIHERAAHAFLVTTAEISHSAREWARGKPITLVDGALLLELTMSVGRSHTG